jgi:transposase InsO family protein
MLRSSAGIATPVQTVAAPESEIGAKCRSTTSGPVREDSHRCSRTLQTERPRKPTPPDLYGLFYAIPNEEVSTLSEVVVTKFFCRFGVQRELHRDQGRNFGSRLLQEVLPRLGVSKTRTKPQHPQSDGMVELYIQTIENHLWKVVASHQWN